MNDTRIITDRPRHLNTDGVETELLRCQINASYDQQPLISDAAALTIASWFQAPRGSGAVFAELATTGQVDRAELLEAARAERAHGDYGPMDDYALDALISWAHHYRNED